MFTRKKKGFTIVELVIVIAVIAILAAVLIPTFATVIGNANKSTAMQAVKSATSDYLSAQMQLNPGQTAKEILGGKTFAYDADGDNTIEAGEYCFSFDADGKTLITNDPDNYNKVVSVGTGEYATLIVTGSKVYKK